jgi:TonB family protein
VLFAIATFALLLTANNACAQQLNVVTEPIAEVQVFVPPEFPPSALKDKVGAQVSVRLQVSASGGIDRIDFPNSEDSVWTAAISEVAKYWLVAPAIDKISCKAIASEMFLRIDFEIDERGKGRTFILQKQTRHKDSTTQLRNAVRKLPPHPDYPRSALVRGLNGRVRAVYQIQPDGSVSGITFPIEAPDNRGFGQAVRKVLEQFKFEFLDDQGKSERRPICVDGDYTFNITP